MSESEDEDDSGDEDSEESEPPVPRYIHRSFWKLILIYKKI